MNKDQQLIWEAYLTEDKFECPEATQSVEVNTKNRDAAIAADHIKYGPLNVDEPGDFWEKIAENGTQLLTQQCNLDVPIV